MWWFLGGKLSYARMVKIGVHLLQCHTHCSLFCSFNDGGESTCRGTGPIFLARPLFSGRLVDQFYFYQPPLLLSHITHALSSNLIIQILVLLNLFHNPSWTWAQVTPTPYA